MEIDDGTRANFPRGVDATYCSSMGSNVDGGVQGGAFNWSIVSRISV